MMIGRGNRSTRRKPAPLPFCPQQTPNAARARTRAAAVGSQRVIAWATARPSVPFLLTTCFGRTRRVILAILARCVSHLFYLRPLSKSAQRIPTADTLGFIDRSRYFFIQVAAQLSSRGWVDPVRDPLRPRKCGRAGNQTRGLSICSQELWPLDHRGGHTFICSL
jgi:hypothetical protein